jgi:hypothetical protein
MILKSFSLSAAQIRARTELPPLAAVLNIHAENRSRRNDETLTRNAVLGRRDFVRRKPDGIRRAVGDCTDNRGISG